MAYYKVCPHCGAHLDPGEACDCTEALRERLKAEILSLTKEDRSQLLKSLKIHQQHPELTLEECVEIAALSAANTKSGKAEQIKAPVSAPIIPGLEV